MRSCLAQLMAACAVCAEHDLKTGFKEMLKEHPDSHKDVDQFIVRFLEGPSVVRPD